MNRREALSSVALLLGGTIIGAEAFLSGCTNSTKNPGAAGLNFAPDDIAFLDEVGETILPATASSPGAKEAKIGQFMKTIVNDCYEEKDQKIFVDGMGQLNEECKKKNSKDFVALTDAEKHDFLVALDKEAKDYMKKKADFDKQQYEKEAAEKAKGNTAYTKEEMPAHYFTMIKQLTLWGYFTSEPGATKALRYVAVPGKYDGCIPYKKGDKAWAT
jgi:Gluconate 2-dehydrogenase subunit 3